MQSRVSYLALRFGVLNIAAGQLIVRELLGSAGMPDSPIRGNQYYCYFCAYTLPIEESSTPELSVDKSPVCFTKTVIALGTHNTNLALAAKDRRAMRPGHPGRLEVLIDGPTGAISTDRRCLGSAADFSALPKCMPSKRLKSIDYAVANCQSNRLYVVSG